MNAETLLPILLMILMVVAIGIVLIREDEKSSENLGMNKQKNEPVQLTEKPTVEERKKILERQITLMMTEGYRIESQSDFRAAMIKGSKVNHILHLLLSVFTAGLWLLVWLLVAIFGGEERKVITVNEFGTVSVLDA